MNLRLAAGDGVPGDIVMSNGTVTTVISQLDAPLDLAPTGGNLIDLGRVAGSDDLLQVYQLAGILPEDAFAYAQQDREATESMVAVTMKGTLAGRPDVRVLTRYELHACDEGVRVRSELFNASADVQAFTVADANHWGKRRIVPFAPKPAQGFVQPPLDLLALTDTWLPHDFTGAAAGATEAPGYSVLACSVRRQEGVNDLEISALGTPLTVLPPGHTMAYERMIFVAGRGQGIAPAVNAALSARGQLFGESTVSIAGTVRASGMAFGGDVRRVGLQLFAGSGAARRPVNAGVPAADGSFTMQAPATGPLSLEVWSFGVLRQTLDVTAGETQVAVEVALPAAVPLAVSVRSTDGAVVNPAYATVAFHPLDESTRAATTGTFFGRFAPCAPWLGPPHGNSPACNRVLVEPRGTDVEVPAGKYLVVATAGPHRTLAQKEVELVAGEVTPLTFELKELPLVPPGWLSADLHVHGRASFDAAIADRDRVQSFVAAGVDVIAATDHDVISNYAATVAALGVGDKVAVMGGLETTQFIPWLALPGADLPKVIGHFNFWPLVPTPGSPRGGAPWDEQLEPGSLFDLMAPLVGRDGAMMMNHPWDEPQVGRDLGYLRAIGFDPRVPIAANQHPNAALLATPSGGHRNGDWNLIELLNGADTAEYQKARVLWFALLAQGWITAATGNSDSHGMTDAQLGWARNWVQTDTQVSSFDTARFNQALRAGRVTAGNGVMVLVEVGPVAGPRRGLGLEPYRAQPGDVVTIEVRAAPWVPVSEVRVITSAGERVVAQGAALRQPLDPFGTGGEMGVVRAQLSIPLRDLVRHDDFLVVEAGVALPALADLDDDGVPDTSDNNGDGVINTADIEPDADSGPIVVPPDPRDRNDPRFWLTRVIPEAIPLGFANPILVDLDGNGWQAPGLGGLGGQP